MPHYSRVYSRQCLLFDKNLDFFFFSWIFHYSFKKNFGDIFRYSILGLYSALKMPMGNFEICVCFKQFPLTVDKSNSQPHWDFKVFFKEVMAGTFRNYSLGVFAIHHHSQNGSSALKSWRVLRTAEPSLRSLAFRGTATWMSPKLWQT